MKDNLKPNITRGSIVTCNISEKKGSVQNGLRPYLVISNDIGNEHSSTFIGAAITSSIKRMDIPTHVVIDDCNCGLQKRSMCEMEQLITLDKSEIVSFIGKVNESVLIDVDTALAISLGLNKRKYIQGRYANIVCLCEDCRDFLQKQNKFVYKRVDPFDNKTGLCQRHNKKGYMYFSYPKEIWRNQNE